MDVVALIAELDQLAIEAAKLAAAEPAFVQKLTTIITEVKVLLPTGTVKGLMTGAEADAKKVKAAAEEVKASVEAAFKKHFG